MSKDWTISMRESFFWELGTRPRKIQTKLHKEVLANLKSDPITTAGANIKKLAGWKKLWRYRLGNERLIYGVNRERRSVNLLMIGDRKHIYQRLGHIPEEGPSLQVKQDEFYGNLLEEWCVDSIKSGAENEALSVKLPVSRTKTRDSQTADQVLPTRYNLDLLDRLSIPEKHHTKLKICKTEEDLMRVDVPAELILKIVEALWPSNLPSVLQTPSRVIQSPRQLEELLTGTKPLEGLLLALDEKQEQFTKRFRGTNPSGPWLVKGGPGSGKSVVALYCIRELVLNHLDTARNSKPDLKILYTTFTRSLSKASRQLFRHLMPKRSGIQVDIQHIHGLAKELVPSPGDRLLDGTFIRRYREACSDVGFPPGSKQYSDYEFAKAEFKWVIVGDQIESLEGYLAVDRRGRKRRLDVKQREDFWHIYTAMRDRMKTNNECFFSDPVAWAVPLMKKNKNKYDYVFVDEAQDVTPAAIRLCVAAARNPANVFLTADTNQSIYGSNFSWQRVSELFSFRGRTTVFKTNYRNTEQIWRAGKSFVHNVNDIDSETLGMEFVYRGRNAQVGLQTRDSRPDIINKWVIEVIREDRTPKSHVAILGSTEAKCKEIVEELSLKSGLNPKFMPRDSFDLHHEGVKVMTLHSAKGLQFPAVVILGLESRQLTSGSPLSRKLLFVGSSRAMRRLLVVVDKEQYETYRETFNKQAWQKYPLETDSPSNKTKKIIVRKRKH